MINFFQISDQAGVIETTPDTGNWLVLEHASSEEQEEIIQKYDLPADIFAASDKSEEISRYEHFDNSKLGKISILSLTNLSAQTKDDIETRLEPLIFILAEDVTITYVGDHSNFGARLIEKHGQEVTSFAKLCAYVILMIYTRYIKELLAIKQTIDELDQAARKTTENKELFRLADTKRDVVYLDHTLRGQRETLQQLWEDEDFTAKLADKKLAFNIQLRQDHADELITIYRDLLEAVGGLFNDMMNNNLNHLMKYLDSAALIISVPALISGIWDMNTGGLPGKSEHLGFIAVSVIGIIATIWMAVHLKRKDYTK